jgi:hypothetical protein
MAHPVFRHLVLATLALVAFHQAASAQSPAGVWGFMTDELPDTCTISGEMTIKQTDGKRFSCTFKAVQSCRLRLPKTIHTDQSCAAVQVGKQVSITSKVDRIVSVDPSSLRAGMEDRYAPDNFIVTINKGGDEMDGLFESMGTAPVRFRRKQELTS